MKKLFLILVGLLLFCKPVFAEPPRYDIDCRVDTATHQIEASQKVTFTNNSQQELNEVYFHVYPHRKYTEAEKEFMLRFAGYFKIDLYPEGFQTGDLKIKNIQADGRDLAFEYQGSDQTILKVKLAQPLEKGETLVLNLDFQAQIPHAFGRFGWNKSSRALDGFTNHIIALSRWYPLLSVLDKDGWHNYPFYPYHQPFFSDAAYYRVKINLPREYTVIHTGNLKERSEDSAQQTLIIDSDLPVREFSWSASPDYKLVSRQDGEVQINSYYLSGDEFYGQKALEFAGDLMANYTRKFGAYPFKQFSIAPVYLGYGGNQLSNMIFLDTRVYQLPKFLIRYFDFLVSHETGHQWFYNLVGNDEYKQMWLDEGLNSYFILEYLEEKYGRDAALMLLPKYADLFIPNFSFRRARDYRYLNSTRFGRDNPVLSKLSSFQEPSSIFSITYGKGSMVLGMLRSLVGDETFDRVMTRYFREFAFKNASAADLIKIVNEESQQDLTWFFDEWLLTTRSCDYAVARVEKKRIVLRNLQQIAMPVETRITLVDGSVQTDTWDGKGKAHLIDLSGQAAVKKVEVDPQEKILDIDRTNNFWPRKLNKKLVPIYFGAYEIPVVLPEDSYNLVYGPEIANNGPGIKASLQKPFDSIFYLSADYDLGDNTVKSSLGYEFKHLFNRQLAVGFQLFKDKDLGGRENDLDGGKIYLRQELWPASYGLTQVNDHISLYILKDQEFTNSITGGGLERIENFHYNKSEETILGSTLTLNRCGPYPDPRTGYNVNATVENAGHFWGGEDYFWRMSADWEGYKSVLKESKVALRLKYGWGSSVDKNLFQLGGREGLRGYRLKAIQGSRTMMGNLEYRFPLVKGINLRAPDNILSLSDIDAVVFTDVGKSWFDDFEAAKFKKDAGLGLRFKIDIGSFLEKVIVRLDIAQAIDDESEDEPRVWLGINHAF
jgi:hypothetical protein